MSPHAARFDEALAWLDLMLGWAQWCDWMPVEFWTPGGSWTEHHEVHVSRSARYRFSSSEVLAGMVRQADELHGAEIQLGIPRMQPDGGTSVCTALWAVTTTPESVKRLERFEPAPSLVLRAGSGSMRWAVWPLNFAVRWVGVERGNRRLAGWLNTPRKWCEPENMWIPAPGTCLRRDRSRPVPVVVERLELDTFDPLEVMGRLKDPPRADPDKWRKVGGR